MARAAVYAGRTPLPEEAIAGTLGIDRGDFIAFCVELETAYGVDLRPLFERDGAFKDATVAEIATYVSSRRISG